MLILSYIDFSYEPSIYSSGIQLSNDLSIVFAINSSSSIVNVILVLFSILYFVNNRGRWERHPVSYTSIWVLSTHSINPCFISSMCCSLFSIICEYLYINSISWILLRHRYPPWIRTCTLYLREFLEENILVKYLTFYHLLHFFSWD